MTGMIFDIARGSFVDGPGIRTTVFFKGCNLRCAWCHNPESQAFDRQRLYYADKCEHCGRCRAVCPSPVHCVLCGKCAEVCRRSAITLAGRSVTADEVMEPIRADRAFYGRDGGATFSGGECMLQPDFLGELLTLCRADGIGTAVDTAGHLPWSAFERILSLVDVFLYDIKAMDSAVHRRYVGVDNERILENYARLIASGKRVIVRVPVVGGVNDTVENMQAMRAYFNRVGVPEAVELLAYHRMGENKARALGETPPVFDPPTSDKMKELKSLFEH